MRIDWHEHRLADKAYDGYENCRGMERYYELYTMINGRAREHDTVTLTDIESRVEPTDRPTGSLLARDLGRISKRIESRVSIAPSWRSIAVETGFGSEL